MLQIEKNYDFRKRMLAIHEKDIRNYDLKPADNQLEVQNNVTVIIPDNDEVILTAARDFIDYLFISMGISAGICADYHHQLGGTLSSNRGGGNQLSVSSVRCIPMQI